MDDVLENSQDSVAGTRTAGEAESQSTTRPPPPKKRKRLTFANKKILGSRHLFLLPEFMSNFADDEVILEGKITKCATKKDHHS